MIKHPFPPLYDKDSKLLILGSFPSVKSRELNFFYSHPQNRFWSVLALVYDCETPVTTDEKKEFLHRRHIALWDVIASCEINGSSDSSITKVVPNDIGKILAAAPIERIFTNGRTAEKYYNKYIFDMCKRRAQYLPSTSPANAAWSAKRLAEEWRIKIKEV